MPQCPLRWAARADPRRERLAAARCAAGWRSPIIWDCASARQSARLKRDQVGVMPFAIFDGTCEVCLEALPTACVHVGFVGNPGLKGGSGRSAPQHEVSARSRTIGDSNAATTGSTDVRLSLSSILRTSADL
jgi:hypothetical protein